MYQCNDLGDLIGVIEQSVSVVVSSSVQQRPLCPQRIRDVQIISRTLTEATGA